MGHLPNDVILPLRPESFRVLLSCANCGFCYLYFNGITKFKYERKNKKDSGRTSKMTPSCKWSVVQKANAKLISPARLLLFSLALNQDVFQIPCYVIGIEASGLLTFNSRMTWTVCHFLSSKRSPLFKYSSNGALGCGPKVSTSFMNPSTNIKAITSGRPLLAPDMDMKKRDERSEEFLKKMYGARIKGIKYTRTFLQRPSL